MSEEEFKNFYREIYIYGMVHALEDVTKDFKELKKNKMLKECEIFNTEEYDTVFNFLLDILEEHTKALRPENFKFELKT